MRKVLYIFGQLSDADIQWLILHGKKVKLQPGEILIHKGIAVPELFIVLEGSLAVSLDDQNHEVLAELGSGEIVGEMSFVDASPPSATVRVLQPSLLYTIQRQILLEKIQTDTGFAARFYHAIAIFLADRLRSIQGLYEFRLNKKAALPAVQADDELNDTVTDSFVIAGERFKRIIDQFMRP